MAPVVVSAWPAFGSAVVAAASTLGYAVTEESVHDLLQMNQKCSSRINLQIPNSELVTNQLGRDQRLSVTRDGVTITFSRDARGRAELSVVGQRHTESELRGLGEELSQRVVQQYVYQRIMAEMDKRGYHVVEEQSGAHQAIHLRIRHWEN